MISSRPLFCNRLEQQAFYDISSENEIAMSNSVYGPFPLSQILAGTSHQFVRPNVPMAACVWIATDANVPSDTRERGVRTVSTLYAQHSRERSEPTLKLSSTSILTVALWRHHQAATAATDADHNDPLAQHYNNFTRSSEHSDHSNYLSL